MSRTFLRRSLLLASSMILMCIAFLPFEVGPTAAAFSRYAPTVQPAATIKISGNVRHFPSMKGLAGVSVHLTGVNGYSTMTGVDGYYEFVGDFTGDYTVTPSGPVPGKLYDPISRTLTNVTGNVSGVDFVAYDEATDAPRKIKVVSQNAVPGAIVVVPIVLTAQGNEAAVDLSIEYDPAQFAGPPTVTCGVDAGVGCTLVTDYSQPGRVGIKVTPVGGTFSAGERQIVALTFQTLQTLAASTPLDLIGSPTNVTVTNSNGSPLLVELMSGAINAHAGFECDVAARPTGDGRLLSNDPIIERQIAVGLVTPDPAFNEFQRADCAPRSTLGDGLITTGDVIQTRRYVAGLDPATPVGGPEGPIVVAPPAALFPMIGVEARGVRALPAVGTVGQKVTVPVEIISSGEVHAVMFTIEYDPTALGKPLVNLGVVPGDAILTINDKESGRLRILIDAGTPFLMSGRLASVTFDVAMTAPDGETNIDIQDGSISDGDANDLTASWSGAMVTILSGPSASFSLSGRVRTPDGGGLRNAQVSIRGDDGTVRIVSTSSLGYYTFDALPAQSYTVSVVSSRRYRFESRKVELNASLSNLDLTGIE